MDAKKEQAKAQAKFDRTVLAISEAEKVLKKMTIPGGWSVSLNTTWEPELQVAGTEDDAAPSPLKMAQFKVLCDQVQELTNCAIKYPGSTGEYLKCASHINGLDISIELYDLRSCTFSYEEKTYQHATISPECLAAAGIDS
jgi:hypothetical protein